MIYLLHCSQLVPGFLCSLFFIFFFHLMWNIRTGTLFKFGEEDESVVSLKCSVLFVHVHNA